MYNNVFTHNAQSIAWAADNIAHADMLFYSLYYDIISLTSLKITQTFHLLLGLQKIKLFFGILKLKNTVAFG